MADVVAQHHPPGPAAAAQHLLLPSLPYNISLNLTSILSLLPSSSFLTRSRLFNSIRKKWWQDMVDVGVMSETATSTVVGLASGSEEQARRISSSTSHNGMVVDIAAWPTEAMLEAVVNEVSGPRAGAGVAAGVAGAAVGGVPPPPPIAYMGPWSFFTSGYMLGLFIVAVLLHRVQNIIIPSRVPSRRRPMRGVGWTQRFAGLNDLWGAVFPLDLGKTTTRLVIHLPSLYYLSKWLFVWFVLVLQTSHLYPVDPGVKWVAQVGSWVEGKDMNEVCWRTFLAVCAGFTVEGFVKALDGVEAGFPIGSNMNPNTSPFNIVGYAFILHLYASPYAHGFRAASNLPSRPDKHAIITITIPLLQLTMFHAMSVSRRLSTHRLLPTTLSSALSLAHFHGALLSYVYGSDWYAFQSGAQSTSPSQTRLLATYPILNYIPNIFETVLICTILLTVVLNVVVQLIIRGRVDRVFSGLGISPSSSSSSYSSSFYTFATNRHQHQSEDETEQLRQFNAGLGEETEHMTTVLGQIQAFFQSLPYDEDFGVLLLRIGTASLEATGLRGWSNEVAPIPAPVLRAQRRGGRRSAAGDVSERKFGSVRVGRVGAGGVQPGYKVPPANTGGAGSGAFRRRGMRRERDEPASPVPIAMRGLRNEVRGVDLGVGSGTSEEIGSSWGIPRARELVDFFKAVWGAFKGLGCLMKAWVVYMVKGHQGTGKTVKGERRDRQLEEDVDEDSDDPMEKEREMYERFLSVENISDDEGEDEEYREGDSGDRHYEEEDTQEESEEGERDDEKEAFGLFTDILRNGTARGDGGGDVVFGHLANKAPMTRRRWRSLSSPDQYRSATRNWYDDDDDDDDDDPFALSLSPSAAIDIGREIAARSVCVICTSEARDIICWPCRCLAMCDGCRESLAARSAPTKHQCPCCRQVIEGYSRIYVP